MITSCQMGEVEMSDYSNCSFPPMFQIFSKIDLMSRPDFLYSLSMCVESTVQASILWMFARCCPEPSLYDESDDVYLAGFQKELGASQELFSEHQQVSYSSFFRSRPGINDPGLWWIHQSHVIRDSFCKRMRDRVLYPSVQRQKNVSESTSLEYNMHIPADYVRTVDLEILRAKAGIEVGGECEMRNAWKFNDLKPRMYYCIGGEQYFASSYIRNVAIAIMEAIPSTFVKIRTDPTQFLTTVLDEDTVSVWDFTSFTTTLSELKYFVWILARIAERGDVNVRLFDYRDGFIDAKLADVLDHYNEVVNMEAGFSVHRLVGMFIRDAEVDMKQMNSGMLGVPGNIGFSTALHGFVVCKECGQSRCVCVGDDALGITNQDPSVSLLPALSKLGIIHPEKVGQLSPSDTQRAVKFLKRRLERVGDLLNLGFLFNFPIAAYIDGISGHRTLPIDFSMEARLFKFSSHVSSLLWSIHEHPTISDKDMDIIWVFLGTAYRYLNLPVNGLFPGQRLHLNKGTDGSVVIQLGYVVPPLFRYDPRRVDWLEYFTQNSTCVYFRGPMFCYPTPVDSLSEGEVLMLPESVWLSALEDLAYVKVDPVSEWLLVADVMNLRVLKRMVRKVDDGFVKACCVRVFKNVPDRFFDTVVKGKLSMLGNAIMEM